MPIADPAVVTALGLAYNWMGLRSQPAWGVAWIGTDRVAEMPSLERLHKTLGPEGVAVVTVSTDEDQEALREIYLAHKDRLLTLALSLVHDMNTAEDILHDVFVSFAGAAGDALSALEKTLDLPLSGPAAGVIAAAHIARSGNRGRTGPALRVAGVYRHRYRQQGRRVVQGQEFVQAHRAFRQSRQPRGGGHRIVGRPVLDPHTQRGGTAERLGRGWCLALGWSVGGHALLLVDLAVSLGPITPGVSPQECVAPARSQRVGVLRVG